MFDYRSNQYLWSIPHLSSSLFRLASFLFYYYYFLFVEIGPNLLRPYCQFIWSVNLLCVVCWFWFWFLFSSSHFTLSPCPSSLGCMHFPIVDLIGVMRYALVVFPI